MSAPLEESVTVHRPETPGRSDVFISYAREDQPFVRRLHDALAQRGRRPWVDWEGIPPSAKWLREVKAAIEAADSFVFVISPDSVSSPVCREEAEHAAATGKRIIPLLRREADDREVPEAVAIHNWILFRDNDDFETSAEALIRAQDTDLEWVRAHTRLLVKAGEWEEGERDRSLLVRGKDLDAAERWLADAGRHAEPTPTPLHTEYILASRRAAVGTQRWRLAGSAAAVIVSLTLALIAFAQQRRAEEQTRLARSRELAASALEQLERDPQLSLLLSIEALESSTTAQAEAALRRALVNSHLRRVLSMGAPETFIDLSPDGALIAAGTVFGEVALWDRATGDRIAVLEPGAEPEAPEGPEGGPPGPGFAFVSFSPDGSRLFSGHEGGDAAIWNVPDGRLVTRLEGGGGFGPGGWTPDGRSVLSAGGGIARLWDAATGVVRAEFRVSAPGSGPGSGVPTFAILSPDGRLVAAQEGLGVRVISVSTGRTVGVFEGELIIPARGFSPDGRRLVLRGTETGEDGVRVFDVVSGRARALTAGTLVVDAAFSPDGDRLLTGGEGDTAHTWDVSTGQVLLELSGHGGDPREVSFSPDGQLALTAGEDSKARVWDAATGRLLAVLAGHPGPVPFARFTPDARFVVTASDPTGDVRVWEVAGGAAAILRGHEGPVPSVRFSPDGRWIASSDVRSGNARIWNVSTETLAAVLRPPLPPGTERHLFPEFSADGRFVLTSGFIGGPTPPSEQEPSRLWDRATGGVLAEFPAQHEGNCKGDFCPTPDAALSPDGTRVATIGETDGSLRIWDVADEAVIETVRLGRHGEGVEWTPDGRRIIALVEERIQVIDATTQRRVREFGPEQGGGIFLAAVSPRVSPDGALVAVGYGDRTARVWEIETGRLVAELEHPAPVSGVAFSPNGQFLVTGSGDAATIWDLASQRQLVQLLGHSGAVGPVDFSPDGTSIVSGGVDRSVRIWKCEVCAPINQLVKLARERVLRDLTPAERARFLHEG